MYIEPSLLLSINSPHSFQIREKITQKNFKTFSVSIFETIKLPFRQKQRSGVLNMYKFGKYDIIVTVLFFANLVYI